jgi:hypothetical protein
VWYPAFALPLLVTTTVIAVIIEKYSAARQVRSGSKRGYSRGSPGDIEDKIRNSDTSNIRSWPSKALNFLSYNKKSTSRTTKNVPSFSGVAPESSAFNDPSRITRADRTDTKESSVPEAALPITTSQRFKSALQYVPASHMKRVSLESDQRPVQHNVNFDRPISKPGGRHTKATRRSSAPPSQTHLWPSSSLLVFAPFESASSLLKRYATTLVVSSSFPELDSPGFVVQSSRFRRIVVAALQM